MRTLAVAFALLSPMARADDGATADAEFRALRSRNSGPRTRGVPTGCVSQDAVDKFHTAQSFGVAADATLGLSVAPISIAVILVLTAPHRQGGRF